MPSSIIGGRLPNGKYKEVSLDASGRLECSVNEIEITADAINVKTASLETLQTAANNTLSSVDNKVILPSVLDSDRLKVYDSAVIGSLAQINNNVDAVETKLDTINTTLTAGGVVDISTLSTHALQTTINNTIGDTNNKIDALRGSNSITDLAGKLNGGLPSALDSDRLKVRLDADLTDTNNKIDAMRGSNSITDLATKLNGGLPAALTGSGNLKVSLEEGGGGDATATNQSTMITELGHIKSSLQSLDDIVQGEDASHGNAHKGVMSLAVRQDTQADFGGDGDYCPMSIDANGDLRVKIDDASKNHLSEIEDAVETIEACVGSNKVNVNISSGNISGFATESTLGDAEAHLGNIDSDTGTLAACVGSNKVNVNISSGNISGFATESTLTDAEAHLGTIDTNIANAEAHLGEIEGAVETIEACCGSNKVNVNISSGNITGFATSTLQGTINTSLGTLETSLTSMENKQDTQITHLSEIEGAVETLEACVSSNKVATINTQNTSGGVWLNSVAVNSTSFSASLETTGFSKLRLFGDVDSDFSGAPPNIIVTGSQTNGGTYTPLDTATDGIDTNSAFISGGSVIGVNAKIDNPPPFIKLYNLHGSTNFTFTLYYKLSN